MAIDRKVVARGLGLFGIGLGIAELVAPKRMARLSGVDGHEDLVRGFGAREIASGIPLLLAEEPAPWLWARVAGDALDAGLLGTGLADPTKRKRALLATLAVAPVVALDLLYALKGQEKDRLQASDDPRSAHIKSREEIERVADPEPLLQLGWRESRREVNGVTLHVVEAGKAGDPLLLLLHGFPEFWWAWRHQITPLAEAGYHVVVPDMRGYNMSDAPQEVSAYTIDTLTADVIALADAYEADRFDLVAHDWGAVIGWWVAAKHPERLKRVVLMDGPHPDVWGRQALTHPTQALRSIYVAFFQLPWVPEATLGSFDHAGLKAMMRGSAKAKTFEPGALEHYARAWSHPGSITAMLNYYRALRERPQDDEPARLAPPTLILWAGDDLFLERHVAEAGLALCDQGQLEFVDGASHWLHIEQPERINARILAWLGEDQ